MVAIITNFINCLITAVVGFYLIKKLTKTEIKLFSLKTIILLLIEASITVFFRQNQYIEFSSLVIYIVNIIIYKEIFDLTLNESLVAVTILMLLMLVADILVTIPLSFMITIKQLQNNWQVFIPANIVIGIVTILLLKIKWLREKLQRFYFNAQKKSTLTNIIFLLLTIILACALAYSIYKNYTLNNRVISDIAIVVILMALIIIHINNRNKYNQLTDEYDNLLTYFQTFEERIEKEEFNKHEYKNQLSVINGLTKEKAVKKKIKELLNEDLSPDEQSVGEFKNLPKGGMKGLMYYKAAIAKKEGINLTVDIKLKKNNSLKKLSDADNNVLCKLIGVYFDNAIEAAKETRKKKVAIEIYEIKGNLSIIISNTFKKKANFDRRNEKGITTKGKGHGNGLYYANKLISKNKWVVSKQEVINEYYIQSIIVDKKKREN